MACQGCAKRKAFVIAVAKKTQTALMRIAARVQARQMEQRTKK
jgi:hypothetical protein